MMTFKEPTQSMLDHIFKLESTNAELLEALRHIEAELNWWENTDDIIDHDNRRSLANVATEAIRKASR